MSNTIIKYFPNLNALRFIAASCVVITHIELLKAFYGVENIWNEPFIMELGSLGVSFFFVLSGFLITYLLLVEKTEKGFISIKNFYMRRVLRIWPLYYLVLIIGFFILPHIDFIKIDYLERNFVENFWGQFWCYLVILPNLGYAIYEVFVPHIGQLWSIGVEEQFYLLWPWVIKFSKRILSTLVYILVGIISIKAVILFLDTSDGPLRVVRVFLASSKVENMVIGGLGALMVYKNHKVVLQILGSNLAFFLSILLIPILVYVMPKFLQDGAHLVNSVLFLIIILNVAVNPASFVNLENKTTRYLGDISYGIYMYHMMIIPFVLFFLKNGSSSFSTTKNLVLYGLVFTLTILIAGVSHKVFERKFIQLKRKFN